MAKIRCLEQFFFVSQGTMVFFFEIPFLDGGPE
jgi:hypothetical protein